VESSPAVGDLDGDGLLEVVVGCNDGKAYSWKGDGTTLSGWPRETGGYIRSSPSLVDLNADQVVDVILGSGDGKVYVWPGIAPAPNPLPWPMFRHDARHTGNYRTGGLFPDTPWDFWAVAEIAACVRASIVLGYGDGTYRPGLPVTRDQMAVYISRALAGGDESVPDPDCTSNPFTDVACDHWARKHIQYCVAADVVQGYPEGDYKPAVKVTRDQMAVYVARSICDPTGEDGLAGYVSADPRDFADVPNAGYGDDGTEPFWAYSHVGYCVENGVVQGYDDGLYHPDWEVTRDQMAVYVARAFGWRM